MDLILLVMYSLLISPIAGSIIPSNLSPGSFHSSTDVGLVLEEVVSETLVQPILYDKVIPLIFQYEIPSWNISEFRLEDYSRQCSDPDDTSIFQPFPYANQGRLIEDGCKILNRLRVMFEKLLPIQLGQIRPLSKESIGKVESLDGTIAKYHGFEKQSMCTKIQRHFPTHLVSSSDLQLYLDWITQECHTITGEKSHIFKSNLFNITFAALLDKMHYYSDNIYYGRMLGGNVWAAYGYMLNSKIALQSLQLANFYEERNRWINAQQDCKLSNIPSTLVSHDELKEGLAQITNSTLSAISVSKEYYQTYYGLPLTDCVHTNDIFLVRVLVPVLSEKLKDKLILTKVTPIPFRYDGHMCTVNVSGSFYIYNEHDGMAYPTLCKPNEICQVQDILIRSKVDKCVSYLLSRKNDSNAKMDIGKFCDILCEKHDHSSSEVFPVAVQVANNKFIVSGKVNQIHIECRSIEGNVRNQVVHSNPSKYGSKLVTIPCGCKLVVESSEYFGSPLCKPDGDSAREFTVYPAIPLMFLNETSPHFRNAWKMHSNDETTRFFNLDDVMDVAKFKQFVELSNDKKKSWKQTFIALNNKKIAELEQKQWKLFTFIFTLGVLMAVGMAIMLWIGIRKVRSLSLQLSTAISTRSNFGTMDTSATTSNNYSAPILYKVGDDEIYGDIS